MKRILEPELMEDEMQALAYSNADFSSSNNLFVDHILKDTNSNFSIVLDLGCGPGDVNIELAKKNPNAKILAVDGSRQMAELAKQKVKNNGLSDRIEIITDRIPDIKISQKDFDVITSKDLLHHIPDPYDFWYEVERLSTEKTLIYVMDLLRPESEELARQIVENVSKDEAEVLKLDFYNSLLAAFTVDEIKEQLSQTRLSYQIRKLGERHFMVKCYNSLNQL